MFDNMIVALKNIRRRQVVIMMWKDKYKIGVELIDTQHKELFNRVSDFIEVLQNKDEWDSKLDKVKETMIFMKEYVVVHFEAEEEYQQQVGYPEFDKHKKVHDDFRNGVNKYAESFEEQGYDREKIQEFAGKLMAWLIMHVAKADQKIGDYVLNKGGQS